MQFRQSGSSLVATKISGFFKIIPAISSLRRRRSKPSIYSVCELVHNIVFEPRRVANTYVGVIGWLVSYVVCG